MCAIEEKIIATDVSLDFLKFQIENFKLGCLNLLIYNHSTPWTLFKTNFTQNAIEAILKEYKTGLQQKLGATQRLFEDRKLVFEEILWRREMLRRHSASEQIMIRRRWTAAIKIQVATFLLTLDNTELQNYIIFMAVIRCDQR